MKQNGKEQHGGIPQDPYRSKVKILMFHRIVNDKQIAEKYWFCIHTERFKRILDLLDMWGYVPITFEDYRMYCDGQLPLPKKPVIITFDDGYKDTYENAFPLLNEYGMKAVVFVLGDRSIECNLWDKHLLGTTAPLLNDRQIIELAEAGIEIGAHSMTHAKLTQLDKETLWHEISQSRVMLEYLLNGRVKSFAYPYGLVNEIVHEFVRYAGFTHACSVWSGPATFGEDNLELRRIPVLNTTNELDLALKLSSPYQYYRWLVWKTKNKINGNERIHIDTNEYFPAQEIDEVVEEKVQV